MGVRLDTLLDEALELWSFTRDGVIAEAESIPEEQYDWRPAPESRSVAELIRHIVEAALFPAGELTRPDGDFKRCPFPEMLAEYAGFVNEVSGRAALIELLRETHVAGEKKYRDAGEVMLLQQIRRFDGVYATRLAWFYHMVDHESYHRGQLALYVRMLGHVPALTRLIHGS